MFCRGAASACSWVLSFSLFSQFRFAAGEIKTGTVRLGEGAEPWQYIGKFGYSVGKGSLNVRARVREPGHAVDAVLQVFLDDDWDLVASKPPCSPMHRMFAKGKRAVSAAHEWGPWTGDSVRTSLRPHIWYFALSTCGLQTNRSYTVDYELHLQQPDGSELSFELRHLSLATLLAILCLSVFLAVFARRCRRVAEGAGRAHPVVLILGASIALLWTAQVLHLLHLQLCKRDGAGRPALETVADSLVILSQVVTSTLLILIARGYTLAVDGRAPLRVVKAVAAAMALLHVALVGHGKMQGDLPDKHHQWQGLAGLAILAARLLLFAWFAVNLRALRQQIGGAKLQSFLQRFEIAGAVYFLSYPALFLLALAFAPYLRHPVMHFGLVATQTMSALWLSNLFLGKGLYFEVSSLGGSLLPSSKVD